MVDKKSLTIVDQDKILTKDNTHGSQLSSFSACTSATSTMLKTKIIQSYTFKLAYNFGKLAIIITRPLIYRTSYLP